MKLSFVVVAHHSSPFLPDAVNSFRREAGALGVTAEVVVVEQSENDGEHEAALATRPDHCVRTSNRGYAAGINAGVARSTGDVLLMANPDLVFRPGSLRPLVEGLSLSRGAAVLGPQFELEGCLFPPAEKQTPWEELRRWRAVTSRGDWKRRLRRELSRSLDVWRVTSANPAPVSVPTLSGALVVTRRDVFERVGPWDEDYFLYFEETDWLRRASRRGMRAAVVPTARVEHRWGHAADPGAPSSGAHFERSRRLYYRRYFGSLGRLVTSRGLSRRSLPFEPEPWSSTAANAHRAAFHLISPSRAGFHAALIEGGTDDPRAVVSRLAEATGRAVPFLYMVGDLSLRIEGPWIVPP